MNPDFISQIITKSDEELADIFLNGKDYQPEFVAAATDEIQRRGLPLDALIEERNERYAALDQRLMAGKSGNDVYILLGYISAFWGGIAGIVVGYIYYQSRQPSVDGQQRYFVYNTATRMHGRNILILGIVVLIVLLFAWIGRLDDFHA